jgi:hypothetical protein
MALPTLAALVALSAGPAPAVAAAPKPAATPLKTISHVYAKRLCTGLRRSIAPAVGRVLQNDKAMELSRPLFQSFVKNTNTGSQAATDMDVMHLERLVDPMVKNTQEIERLLNDTVYPRKPQSDEDKQLLEMRAQLEVVLAHQKQALDLISGFVDTQNMAELQAAGHEYDSAINSTDTHNSKSTPPPQPAPTAAAAPILNAGVSQANDPAHQYDPRFKNTGSDLGYNPLSAFDQQMAVYQQMIEQPENKVSAAIFKAIPECGGTVPAQPSPPPAPAAAPSPTPLKP